MTDSEGQQAYLTLFRAGTILYFSYLPAVYGLIMFSTLSSLSLCGVIVYLCLFSLQCDPPFFHSWGIYDGYHSVIYWTTHIAHHSHKISDFRRLFFFFFFFHRQINSGQYILVMMVFFFLLFQDGFIKIGCKDTHAGHNALFSLLTLQNQSLANFTQILL